MNDLTDTAETIAVDRMRHYGYTDAQIEALGERVDHEAAGCEFDTNSLTWECRDEDDESRHPRADEMDQTAEFVMWVLEHPALQPLIDAEKQHAVEAAVEAAAGLAETCATGEHAAVVIRFTAKSVRETRRPACTEEGS